MKKSLICLAALLLAVIYASPCFSGGDKPDYVTELLARAKADECYNGIGGDYIPGPDSEYGSDCASGQKPKANQAYLWGLTKHEDNLWFGTAANMLCLMRAFNIYQQDGDATAYENSLWACEYDEGKYPDQEMASPLPGEVFSDYRPPRIYTYDIENHELEDQTHKVSEPGARMLLENTFGLRSAGSLDGVVFLAGPVALEEGINMFAFDADTGKFLGAKTLEQYQNIRKWTVHNDVLYTAVADYETGGKVLRWTGSRENPFSFEEVGSLDGSGAEIVAHEGRLFVGTWPSRTLDEPTMAGIWMSPEIPDEGLDSGDSDNWQKVWQPDEYEPDPVNALLYGVGAMESFDGYLYWGTMHVHGKAALFFTQQNNISSAKLPQTYFNTWRATSIFRGKNFAQDREVELLYGNRTMAVYKKTGDSSGYWTRRYNKMGGVRGKYGESGFDNIYNNYAWTMEVYNGELFVGTMDHSYLWLDWNNLQRAYIKGTYFTIPLPRIPLYYTPSEEEYGADLWRFPSSDSEAVRVSRDGMGNFVNYGIRSILADEDTGLYLGTASSANIHQDDDGNLEAGWELLRISRTK